MDIGLDNRGYEWIIETNHFRGHVPFSQIGEQFHVAANQGV